MLDNLVISTWYKVKRIIMQNTIIVNAFLSKPFY